MDKNIHKLIRLLLEELNYIELSLVFPDNWGKEERLQARRVIKEYNKKTKNLLKTIGYYDFY